MTGPLADRLAAGLSGRYAVQRLLGQGGMASVFLAEPATGGHVAIKALRPELAQTIGAERFLREIELERGLDHPGIIRILDSGEADGSAIRAPRARSPRRGTSVLRDRVR